MDVWSMPASRQPSKKQLKLWESISQCVDSNNIQGAIEGCYAMILESEPFDSLAFLSRSFLAEYYMTTQDMGDVYDSFVYFREYLKYYPDSYSAQDYKKRLKDYYWKLVEDDLSNETMNGLYISGRQADDGRPFVALFLEDSSYGIQAILDPRCLLFKNLKKFQKASDFEGIYYPTSLLEDPSNHDMPYMAQWGGQKVKNPHLGTSAVLAGMAINLNEETSAALDAAPEGNLGGTLAVQTGSLLVQMGFAALANWLSKGSVTASSLSIKLGRTHGQGEVAGVIDLKVRKEFTNKPTEENEETIYITLFKVYPHDEIFFKNGLCYPTQGASLCAKKSKKWVNHFPAVSYNDGNRFGLKRKSKKLNDMMYVHLYEDRVFQPILKIAEIDSIVRDANIHTGITSSGNHMLYQLNEHHKKGEPEKKWYLEQNGIDLFFGQYYSNNENDLLTYYYDGDSKQYIRQKRENGIFTGALERYDADCNMIEYIPYHEGMSNGVGLRRDSDALIYETWQDDKRISTDSIWYKNGDVFVGQIVENKPHGQGTMRFQNGNIYQGGFVQGIMEGEGQMISSDGHIQQGIWHEGTLTPKKSNSKTRIRGKKKKSRR